MKIAVLSDIHANAQALDAVLYDCETQKVDAFWLLGDYVDYCAATEAVLSRIESLSAEHIISGNHDACLFLPYVRPSATAHGKAAYEWLLEHAQSKPQAFGWLKGISETPMKILDERKIMLVHGTPNDPYWGNFLPGEPNSTEQLIAAMDAQDVDTLFMGHSHVSFMLTKTGKTIINPGSVGQPRNGYPCAQYAIYQDGNVEFRRIQYDIEATAADIRRAGLPEHLWQRLFVGK